MDRGDRRLKLVRPGSPAGKRPGDERHPLGDVAGVPEAAILPLSLMRCLARLMRRVMVSSGTRNARAISTVVRPPTARKVSAICDAGESDG
jgi:hypothetical protein